MSPEFEPFEFSVIRRKCAHCQVSSPILKLDDKTSKNVTMHLQDYTDGEDYIENALLDILFRVLGLILVLPRLVKGFGASSVEGGRMVNALFAFESLCLLRIVDNLHAV
jgi:hypothetical protein